MNRLFFMLIIFMTAMAVALDAGKMCHVLVSTTPNGATIKIDGITRGKSPVEVSLQKGIRVEVETSRKGYEPYHQGFTPTKDPDELMIRLRKLHI